MDGWDVPINVYVVSRGGDGDVLGRGGSRGKTSGGNIYSITFGRIKLATTRCCVYGKYRISIWNTGNDIINNKILISWDINGTISKPCRP